MLKVTSPPLDPPSVREMYDLWKLAFGIDIEPDISSDVLAGNESDANDFRVYRELMTGQIAATAIVVVPLGLPELGALGEVATHPLFRNRGLATGLCRRLLEDFKDQGGEALFLGTVNPSAARIYEKLGWSHIPDTKLMVNLAGEESPNEYLANYFADLVPLGVRVGESSSRIPIIPLIISPHDWSVMDANVSIISTRIEKQISCLGLYNRYHYLREKSLGEWFTLVTQEGKVLGISSAVHVNGRRYQIDGFCHVSYADSFRDLIQAAIAWCSDHGAADITMRLSSEDEAKKSLINSLGFHKPRLDGFFQYDNKKVDALLYSFD